MIFRIPKSIQYNYRKNFKTRLLKKGTKNAPAFSVGKEQKETKQYLDPNYNLDHVTLYRKTGGVEVCQTTLPH